MADIFALGNEDLKTLHARTAARYTAFKERGVRLDMTRGKPSPDQLDLSNSLLSNLDVSACLRSDGIDCRNYSPASQGLLEARQLFAGMIGTTADRVIVGGNASLALMHDAIVFALLNGVPGSKEPWKSNGQTTFLCPVPGYDRHFAICENYGIRMLSVPLTGEGPDMNIVEDLVRKDSSIKGIWCVPKYSNPTGEVYSQKVSERLASMEASQDFRIFWDNAYAVHHLGLTHHDVPSIIDLCAKAGNPNRPFVFASTSKITFAGSGLAFFASSPQNTDWFMRHMSRQTIGPDKINQVRHIQFLGSERGLLEHMEKHRQILAPKFKAVDDVLTEELNATGVAAWTRPDGGYFISINVREGCANRVVQLSKNAGVLLTAAGSTFPYGKDPLDRNLRIAPSYPSLDDVKQASEGIAISVLLAAVESILAERAVTVAETY